MLGLLMNKDREILELKGNIAELLAVMPSNHNIGHSVAPGKDLLNTRPDIHLNIGWFSWLDLCHVNAIQDSTKLQSNLPTSMLFKEFGNEIMIRLIKH